MSERIRTKIGYIREEEHYYESIGEFDHKKLRFHLFLLRNNKDTSVQVTRIKEINFRGSKMS